MWWLWYGVCPDGELDHTCYRRNCVSILHLVETTHHGNLTSGNERRAREREAYRLLEAAGLDVRALTDPTVALDARVSRL